MKLIVGGKCLGMLKAVGEEFPAGKYQRLPSAFTVVCSHSHLDSIQGEAGSQNAQGDLRSGEQEICPGKG